MGIDIVIRCERGDVVIRLENTGHENSSMSPQSWVELLAILMCTGCLGSRCGADPHCLGGTHFLGCFSLWLESKITLRAAFLA